MQTISTQINMNANYGCRTLNDRHLVLLFKLRIDDDRVLMNQSAQSLQGLINTPSTPGGESVLSPAPPAHGSQRSVSAAELQSWTQPGPKDNSVCCLSFLVVNRCCHGTCGDN